jgi:hypothetical protein
METGRVAAVMGDPLRVIHIGFLAQVAFWHDRSKG